MADDKTSAETQGNNPAKDANDNADTQSVQHDSHVQVYKDQQHDSHVRLYNQISSGQTPEDEKPDVEKEKAGLDGTEKTKDGFNENAKGAGETPETETITENYPSGYKKNKDGSILWLNDPSQPLGQGFLELLATLLAYLTGDFEHPFLIRQKDKERYERAMGVDTVERNYDDPAIQKVVDVKKYVEEVRDNPDHPDRNMTKGEFFQKKIASKLPDVAGPIATLINYIDLKESGGDLCIVNDYRSRVPTFRNDKNHPDWPFKGLQPGDTTPGGLTVPDCTKTSVKDIIAWQKAYTKEQVNYRDADFPKGIPVPVHKNSSATEIEREAAVSSRVKSQANYFRSSAIGARQHLYGTLQARVDQGYISEDEPFDQDAQMRATLGGVIERIKLAHNNKPGAQPGELANEVVKQLRHEWEGLKHLETDALRSVVEDIIHDPSQIQKLNDMAKPN